MLDYHIYFILLHGRKVLHQHAVDKDVAPTDSAKEDAVGNIIEKGEKVIMAKQPIHILALALQLL
jgi:hypothetical protein